MAKITIKVVPAQGPTKTVEVEATHATLGDILKKAGLELKSFVATVAGKAVDVTSMLADGAEVALTEKVRGS